MNSKSILLFVRNKLFVGSGKYWENRYNIGGNSGVGSYGKLAKFKAKIINSFVEDVKIDSIIDFGCGDGYQLSLFHFPHYTGLDVSQTAIKQCMVQFESDKTKSFFLYEPESFKGGNSIFKADLGLSLDVIFHLVEDDLFELYMKHLFLSATKFVIIYSDNIDTSQKYHEKPRQFSRWIEANAPQWKLMKSIKNKYPDEARSDFFIFKRMYSINEKDIDLEKKK